MYRVEEKKANVSIMRRLIVALLLWSSLANVTAIVAGAQQCIGVSRASTFYTGNGPTDSARHSVASLRLGLAQCPPPRPQRCDNRTGRSGDRDAKVLAQTATAVPLF